MPPVVVIVVVAACMAVNKHISLTPPTVSMYSEEGNYCTRKASNSATAWSVCAGSRMSGSV